MKYLLILVLFTSCATQKKAEKYYSKHPEQLAEVCIDKFPLDTVSKTDTFYQKADNVDYSDLIDSIYELSNYGNIGDNRKPTFGIPDTDSVLIYKGGVLKKVNVELYKQVTKLKQSYKPCIPDTVRLTNTITVEDKRKLFIVQNDLDKEKKAHNKTIIGKHVFMWWAIVATILLAFLILINYFKIKI